MISTPGRAAATQRGTVLPERRPSAVGRGLAVSALIAALGLATFSPPQPLLIWNVSASAPVGLYGIGARQDVVRGDMVAAWVPQPWRKLAAARHYLPANVPLVKRVAAIPGDRICAIGGAVFVNGALAARRRDVDGRGRPMPRWTGCVTLGRGGLFLLVDAPDSFDGRYFGPTESGEIIGRAMPLWVA